jgi:two-component system NtrC family sensor kinase
MEAMPDGGDLFIYSGESDREVYITVRDTGSGISQDRVPQVFDPFFTTKADGTGLGLSVSYGIIEGHGGQIEVQSVPGEFTEFVVRLPLITE